jgi:hypothetical protein
MTTGTKWTAIGALLALGFFAFTAAHAAEFGVADLLQEFRQVPSVKARFVERKTVALLTAPLESSGTLEYEAPGRLTKTVLKPAPEKMVLQGDRLVIESRRAGKVERRTLSVREHPALWALVESIRGTLAGDLATLNRFYKVELEGTESKWILRLVPSDPSVLAYLSEVRLSGSAAWIERVEMSEASGDRSTMVISRDAR